MNYEVTLINSYAVSQNRKQQMMRREKDDPIDVAAIGDLLRRGEGTAYHPLQGIYLELQQLDRVRQGKVKMRTMLKNQIIGHLDRIFPGLVIIGAAAKERYTPMFATDFWECQTMQHLVRVCPDPRQLAAMSTTDLVAAFHAHNFKIRQNRRCSSAPCLARCRPHLQPAPTRFVQLLRQTQTDQT